MFLVASGLLTPVFIRAKNFVTSTVYIKKNTDFTFRVLSVNRTVSEEIKQNRGNVSLNVAQFSKLVNMI